MTADLTCRSSPRTVLSRTATTPKAYPVASSRTGQPVGGDGGVVTPRARRDGRAGRAARLVDEGAGRGERRAGDEAEVVGLGPVDLLVEGVGVTRRWRRRRPAWLAATSGTVR